MTLAADNSASSRRHNSILLIGVCSWSIPIPPPSRVTARAGPSQRGTPGRPLRYISRCTPPRAPRRDHRPGVVLHGATEGGRLLLLGDVRWGLDLGAQMVGRP